MSKNFQIWKLHGLVVWRLLHKWDRWLLQSAIAILIAEKAQGPNPCGAIPFCPSVLFQANYFGQSWSSTLGVVVPVVSLPRTEVTSSHFFSYQHSTIQCKRFKGGQFCGRSWHLPDKCVHLVEHIIHHEIGIRTESSHCRIKMVILNNPSSRYSDNQVL